MGAFFITLFGIESASSRSLKLSSGFAVNQEVPANAVDHSLIPIKQALRTLHFVVCFG